MSTTTGPARDKVTFLMYSVDGGGGVARTVINLANELVGEREVEILSVVDRRGGPRFRVDERVPVTYLMTRSQKRPAGLEAGDLRWRNRPSRNAVTRWLNRRPTRLTRYADGGASAGMSAWTDRVIRRGVRSVREGILISTRPSLHVAVTRWARPGITTIGQDHLNFPTRSRIEPSMSAQREAMQGLDALVVLTAGDRVDYRAWQPDARARVEVIPNGSSWPVTDDPAPLTAPVAVAGGRLEKQKAFVRMVKVWGRVAEEFPDWQLHIYGRGEEQEAIEKAIAQQGLEGSVILKGYSEDFDQVLRSSSIYLMTSKFEGFPMVLVEAMGQGLPLVAFDCPRGPADVIDDGVNGRLLADGDRAGYAQALRELMADRELRRRMGTAGIERARGYQMPQIAARWVGLFETLGRR